MADDQGMEVRAKMEGYTLRTGEHRAGADPAPDEQGTEGRPGAE